MDNEKLIRYLIDHGVDVNNDNFFFLISYRSLKFIKLEMKNFIKYLIDYTNSYFTSKSCM